MDGKPETDTLRSRSAHRPKPFVMEYLDATPLE
jgi:hypothetical protein